MKTFEGYRKDKDGNSIHPDHICNRCRKKITGGMMQFSNTTHHCIPCYNQIMLAKKLTEGPLFNQ
jgi:hypothetical protein